MWDSSAAFSGLWGPVYGVLQHQKVYSMHHDALWPRGIVRRIATCEIYGVTYLVLVKLDLKLYKASEFRKPY